MSKEIGEKINELRSSKGMTLKDLSEKVSLSSSFLSQAERGLTSITINTLKKIAEALEVDMSFFFDTPKKQKPEIRRGYNLTPFRIDESKFVYYDLGSDLPDRRFDPFLVTILPGEKGENRVPGDHPGEEFLYVLEGILTILLEDTEMDMYPGDSIHFSSGTSHDWINHTNKIVKLLNVSGPSLFK